MNWYAEFKTVPEWFDALENTYKRRIEERDEQIKCLLKEAKSPEGVLVYVSKLVQLMDDADNPAYIELMRRIKKDIDSVK